MRKLLLLVAAVSLAACTTANKMYRSAGHSVETIGPNRDVLAFIESDDMGELFHSEQLRNALEEIRNSRDDKDGALIITYVHGWNHNAGGTTSLDDEDNNLRGFREGVLLRMIQQEAIAASDRNAAELDSTLRTHRPRRVIGVYIGWRGALYRDPFSKLFPFSYYNRNSAATRVAGSTSSEVLAAITHAARLNSQSRSIVIAHSMGGLIAEAGLIPPTQESLENSAQKALDNSAVELREPVTDGVVTVDTFGKPTKSPRRALPVDLVILINPASRAIQARKFLGMLNRWNVQSEDKIPSPYLMSEQTEKADTSTQVEPKPAKSNPKNARPLIVSVTSESDSDTGWIFQTANRLILANKNFRPAYDADDKVVPPFGTQRDLFIHNAGHWKDLFSHTIRREPITGAAAPDLAERVRTCGTVPINSDLDQKSPRVLCVAVGNDRFWIAEKPDVANRRPYWIAQIQKSVVDGHSDIFVPPFYRLMKAFLALTGGFDTPRVPNEATQRLAAADGTVWGPTLDGEVITSQMPARCDTPKEIVVKYTGGVSGCPSQRDSCFAGEPLQLELAGELFPCDIVEWHVDGLTTIQANRVLVKRLASVSGTVTVFNDFGKRTQSFRIPYAPDALPVRIAYTGDGCSSDTSNRCTARKPITFTAKVEGTLQSPTFEWSIDGRVVPNESGNTLMHPGLPEGDVEVTATVVAQGRFGMGFIPLSVIERDPQLDTPVITVESEPQEPCDLGEKCFGGAIRLTTQYRAPFRPRWTIDGIPMSEGEVLTPRLSQGSHTIEATVTSVAEPLQSMTGTRTINVCGPPPPAVIDFTGADSKCTAANACCGQPCWVGETISFRVRRTDGQPLQGCEGVLWTLGAKGEQTSASPSASFSEPSEQWIRVRLENATGETATSTVLRVVPPCRNCPPPPVSDCCHQIPPPPLRDCCPPGGGSGGGSGGSSGGSLGCKPLSSVSIAYDAPSKCTPKSACKPGERIEFTIVSDDPLSKDCDDRVTWLFDDGSTQDGFTAAKRFGRGRPPHAIHAVVIRKGVAKTAITHVNIPLLKCKAAPCAEHPVRRKQ